MQTNRLVGLLIGMIITGRILLAGDTLTYTVPNTSFVDTSVTCEYQKWKRTCAKTFLDLEDLPERYQTIIKGAPVMQMLGSGVMSVIYAFPSDVSNWDKDSFRSKPLWRNWSDHVKAGPVWDKDSWLINYVEHPYVGSSYYVWGRDAGLSRRESFGLAVFLSAVYWEYGWEALIEPPSIQDLIVTPLVGSVAGEFAYRMKRKIIANDGMFLGSRLLGGIAKVLLDPIGETNALFAHFLNAKHFDSDVHFELFYTRQKTQRTDQLFLHTDDQRASARIGLRVNVRF